LLPVAEAYEKDKRPHSAIAIYREVLALDPEHAKALDSVDRIAALPDPSLAADSSGIDLFEDVSDEWIRKHDEEHSTWGKRAKYKSEYYTVYTDAGYKVLIQAAKAMDQMHLFYKDFFSVTGSVARIDLNIFKTREGYLKKGIGPPVEWSGGHFTGGAVETYIGQSGFQGALSTLFHEAAHQFVNKATSAGGWLNEGLASFFQGTRLQANGTVLMNLPAMDRMGPLVARLRRGWMKDVKDGIDAGEPNKTPETSPTFDVILQNKYAWGPPWYAPTWGVVYFCYNYQDPKDGRFIYRESFLEFLNKSGGRTGDSAVGNFEKVVLENPAPPTSGVKSDIALPETVAELNELWKDWLINLSDEVNGVKVGERPYLNWGRYAIQRKEFTTAAEHFEKGLAATPNVPELMSGYAELLADELGNEDRAAKLILQVLRVLESADEPDTRAIAKAEKLLGKWDPKRESLDKVHSQINATAISLIQRYLSNGHNMMTMHLASRMGTDLNVPGVNAFYEEAWRRCGKSLDLWKLAYNEQDLKGWSSGPESPFVSNGDSLDTNFGTYDAKDFRYATLPMDLITTGDYSLEAEIFAGSGKVGFCGLAFGMRGSGVFNALILLPGKGSSGVVAGSAFIDLASFSGGGSPRVLRHVPAIDPKKIGQSTTEQWKKLRLEVTGTHCDVYLNDELKVVHEFPSRSSVSGSLGLITGTGSGRFRNVRYLSRSPRDVGAALERKAKMEKFGDADQSIGGSWLGKKAPFPVVSGWLKGERKDWKEAGPVPQLLVMWSIRQNETIRIDRWLQKLQEQYSNVGLRILSVCSIEDKAKLKGYLEGAKFPGSIALDGPVADLGDTFDDYSILSFNLPRLILIDIDGKVVWEGDPGFSAGRRWKPGAETYLDAPLDELIAGRNLAELGTWRTAWKTVAIDALHNADFQTAYPILLQSKNFKARGDVDVFEAQSRLNSVIGALQAMDSTLSGFERQGCEAALTTLLDWGKLLAHKLDKQAARDAKSASKGSGAKGWKATLEFLKAHKLRVKRNGEEAALDEIRTELGKSESRLAALLLENLDGLTGEAANDEIARASDLDKLWLAREYFRW
ncbi:MAG: tetratricopeptide (TPR) repeat protein, partial [Planctomycetota bacterium]